MAVTKEQIFSAADVLPAGRLAARVAFPYDL